MSSTSDQRRVGAAIGSVLALLAACAPIGSTPTPVSAKVLTQPAHSAVPPTAAASAAAPAFVLGTPTALSTTTPDAGVQVTALGNVYIRRGPDLAFNPIAFLSEGEEVTATGRDVLSNWLRIPLPQDTSNYGWISIMSEFTEVHGDLSALPEIEPQEWPELASFRNCTYHELWIEPAGITLPPVYEFPNNELRLNPGTYSILDVDLPGYPVVLEAELREGMMIDVLVDGFGEKKKCPPP